MQLNIDFSIHSTYNKKTDCNSISITVDSRKSTLEHLTTLEMAKDALINALEAYVNKGMPEGMLTEKQYEELITTPIKKLKGFEV